MLDSSMLTISMSLDICTVIVMISIAYVIFLLRCGGFRRRRQELPVEVPPQESPLEDSVLESSDDAKSDGARRPRFISLPDLNAGDIEGHISRIERLQRELEALESYTNGRRDYHCAEDIKVSDRFGKTRWSMSGHSHIYQSDAHRPDLDVDGIPRSRYRNLSSASSTQSLCSLNSPESDKVFLYPSAGRLGKNRLRRRRRQHHGRLRSASSEPDIDANLAWDAHKSQSDLHSPTAGGVVYDDIDIDTESEGERESPYSSGEDSSDFVEDDICHLTLKTNRRGRARRRRGQSVSDDTASSKSEALTTLSHLLHIDGLVTCTSPEPQTEEPKKVKEPLTTEQNKMKQLLDRWTFNYDLDTSKTYGGKTEHYQLVDVTSLEITEPEITDVNLATLVPKDSKVTGDTDENINNSNKADIIGAGVMSPEDRGKVQLDVASNIQESGEPQFDTEGAAENRAMTDKELEQLLDDCMNESESELLQESPSVFSFESFTSIPPINVSATSSVPDDEQPSEEENNTIAKEIDPRDEMNRSDHLNAYISGYEASRCITPAYLDDQKQKDDTDGGIDGNNDEAVNDDTQGVNDDIDPQQAVYHDRETMSISVSMEMNDYSTSDFSELDCSSIASPIITEKSSFESLEYGDFPGNGTTEDSMHEPGDAGLIEDDDKLGKIAAKAKDDLQETDIEILPDESKVGHDPVLEDAADDESDSEGDLTHCTEVTSDTDDADDEDQPIIVISSESDDVEEESIDEEDLSRCLEDIEPFEPKPDVDAELSSDSEGESDNASSNECADEEILSFSCKPDDEAGLVAESESNTKEQETIKDESDITEASKENDTISDGGRLSLEVNEDKVISNDTESDTQDCTTDITPFSDLDNANSEFSDTAKDETMDADEDSVSSEPEEEPCGTCVDGIPPVSSPFSPDEADSDETIDKEDSASGSDRESDDDLADCTSGITRFSDTGSRKSSIGGVSDDEEDDDRTSKKGDSDESAEASDMDCTSGIQPFSDAASEANDEDMPADVEESTDEEGSETDGLEDCTTGITPFSDTNSFHSSQTSIQETADPDDLCLEGDGDLEGDESDEEDCTTGIARFSDADNSSAASIPEVVDADSDTAQSESSGLDSDDEQDCTTGIAAFSDTNSQPEEALDAEEDDASIGTEDSDEDEEQDCTTGIAAFSDTNSQASVEEALGACADTASISSEESAVSDEEQDCTAGITAFSDTNSQASVEEALDAEDVSASSTEYNDIASDEEQDCTTGIEPFSDTNSIQETVENEADSSMEHIVPESEEDLDCLTGITPFSTDISVHSSHSDLREESGSDGEDQASDSDDEEDCMDGISRFSADDSAHSSQSSLHKDNDSKASPDTDEDMEAEESEKEEEPPTDKISDPDDIPGHALDHAEECPTNNEREGASPEELVEEELGFDLDGEVDDESDTEICKADADADVIDTDSIAEQHTGDNKAKDDIPDNKGVGDDDYNGDDSRQTEEEIQIIVADEDDDDANDEETGSSNNEIEDQTAVIVEPKPAEPKQEVLARAQPPTMLEITPIITMETDRLPTLQEDIVASTPDIEDVSPLSPLSSRIPVPVRKRRSSFGSLIPQTDEQINEATFSSDEEDLYPGSAIPERLSIPSGIDDVPPPPNTPTRPSRIPVRTQSYSDHDSSFDDDMPLEFFSGSEGWSEHDEFTLESPTLHSPGSKQPRLLSRASMSSDVLEVIAEHNDEPDEDTERLAKILDEYLKTTQRIIEDHKPLVEDLVTTGHELMELCTDEDASDIKEDVDNVTAKYDEVKGSVREKLNQLDEAFRSGTSDVGDTLDGLLEELHYLNDQVEHYDPIAANPDALKEQINENNAVVDDLERRQTAILNTKDAVGRILEDESPENAEDHADLRSKLQDLDSLQENIRHQTRARAGALEEALGVAEKFGHDWQDAIQALRDIQDNLVSQDSPGVDPPTIEEQQRELEQIQADLSRAEHPISEARKTAEHLSSLAGLPGRMEIQKHLEDMDNMLEEIQDGVQDRGEELDTALDRANKYEQVLQTIMSWLPKAEDKLSNMAPVSGDPRSVRIQIEELKVFKVQTHPRYVDIQSLNQHASDLKNASPVTAEALSPQVKEVNERWNNVLRNTADRERQLKEALIHLGELDHAIEDILGFLAQAETDLSQLDMVYGDPKFIETHLKKIKMMQKDLANAEPTVKKLNLAVDKIVDRAGQQASPLKGKMEELNEMYHSVNIMARDRQNELQDRLKEVKAFMGEVEDALRWMNDYRVDLRASSPMGALPDTAQKQFDKFMAKYMELQAKEEQGRTLLLNGEDMLARCRDEDAIALRENLGRLQAKMYDTRNKSERRKRKLEEHLNNVRDFHAMLKIHTDWLNNAEKILGSFKHPSKIVDRVLKQIQDHRDFRSDIEAHREIMQNLDRTGTYLKYFGRKQDTIYIKNLLISIKLRWKKLVRRADEKGRLLQQAHKEDKRFYDAWKGLCDWLDDGERKLKKYATASPAKVKQDIDELKYFQHQMATKHPNYYSTMRLGRSLKDRCTKTDPERDMLSSMLDDLKNKWNILRSIVAQRQNKLDEALLSSGRFADALQSLLEWLGKAETYLSEDQPILGDLDTVHILIEQHKAFQQELESRQAMVQAMRASPNVDASVANQLDELTHVWERVNQLSDVRETRLQEALKLAEDFNEAVQVVREWLPQAEAELKFRALPEDEDNIVNLIEHHEKFQEDLRGQQPNIERIRYLAEEILQACHPNAVRFVKYYLTITQTRWEQALNRSNQRSQRLQEALRNIRGNAALLEELLAWLTEAQALLSAKEKDPIPEDLTVVEALVKEHLEFHDDLSNKNKDVDRLTKLTSAPSPARKQLHGSQYRLNETEAPSPRVTTLQNKWRTVWRISVDRKKKLQDALDQLLELESFKNFDFDLWRQRYISWIRAKKFRITDFFRRQDKDGDGSLSRKEFVEGMLASRFPTNKTELNAVFDIFDRNHSGTLDYQEFVNALRPDRQRVNRNRGGKKPATDSELIHDEIEQQVSHCQCRNAFKVHKIGEGKYKMGEKGKLCLVRFLNSSVMVRVGGGWCTLNEFLENNDPCRAKGRTNTELREQFILPEGASQSRVAFSPANRRMSTPNPNRNARGSVDHGTPPKALNAKLSGSTSSLASTGRISAPPRGNLANKKNTQMAKSWSNLSAPSATSTPRRASAYPGSAGDSSTPRSRKTGAATTPRSGRTGTAASNGASTPTNGRSTPNSTGRHTPTGGRTPTGQRSRSPASRGTTSRSGGGPRKMSTTPKTMNF